jgi:hypothetical protein
VANGWGGRRPGAGRKSKATEKRQAKFRAITETVITEQDWEEMVRGQVAEAKNGNVAAFRELAPWVVGRVPEESEVNLNGDIMIYLPARQTVTHGDPDGRR